MRQNYESNSKFYHEVVLKCLADLRGKHCDYWTLAFFRPIATAMKLKKSFANNYKPSRSVSADILKQLLSKIQAIIFF